MGEFLKENLKKEADLAVVSAYFTIYAYKQLQEQLDGINSLHFLFGEPSFLKAIDPSKTNRKDFKIADDRLVIPLERRLEQKAVAKECADWLRQKAEVKSMVKPNFLHGKMYHISQKTGIEKAIVGSSNFTVNGLGMGNMPNIELNLAIDSERDRDDLKDWFYELWNDKTGLVEDVKEKVLHYLEEMYLENSPEFIYFKTLFHIFGQFVTEQEKGGLLNEKTGFFESQIWRELYDFQRDGVKGAINKILKHNGCILADSVGLGKTYEALAVIKYFELLNYNVLVLCPKKLADNWTLFQASQSHQDNPFRKDKFRYSVLYHTDLGRKTGRSEANGIDLENFHWGSFDLVVIDESHNFRGNPSEKTNAENEVVLNRAKWLMEMILKQGTQTKVLLLSATPVNNNLRDLRNQIYLITGGENQLLTGSAPLEDIGQIIVQAQTQFTLWADPKKNKDRVLKHLLERLDTAFFKMLDDLTIARSRRHIMRYYDMTQIGKFPERLPPQPIYPEIDLKGRFPSYDELNKQILKYKLTVFNPSAYVKPGLENKYGIKTAAEKAEEKRKREEKKRKKKKDDESTPAPREQNFDQGVREHFLIGMMKVNFLKRLESSIESFEISMDRTIQKIEKLIGRIEAYLEVEAARPAKDREDGGHSQVETLESLMPEPSEYEGEDEDLEIWQVGVKLKFDFSDLQLDKWLEDLRKDKAALVDLYNNAVAVSPERDAKLDALKKLIAAKTKKPLNEGNRKVIVFTAFADTAVYLYKNLVEWAGKELNLKAALVAGTTTSTTLGKNDFNSILTQFSPRSRKKYQKHPEAPEQEIDLLIATDCISEGQNLQDCDYLINYDIHWNPVRIIQRFGRIDRIGSRNKVIQLVNFWPTKDLDNYINLKERVEARMALVDVTATGEDNILNTDQLENLIEEDLKYRNQQLKRLKEEVLELEEMSESISLTDFTLDDFRVDLMNYIEKNKEKLQEAEQGLYALVPSPGGKYASLASRQDLPAAAVEIMQPGVIYCLCQVDYPEGAEKINPLQPYFLVYVRSDGNVRYNYMHPKQILEMYRMLCQGRTSPYEALCDIFNAETQNGKDMDAYSKLLKPAVREIRNTFTRRNHAALTANRGAQLVTETRHLEESTGFELVTWLVIK